MCDENVTWRCRSVQCFKWVHVRCSLFSSSMFNALANSHFWSCPLCGTFASGELLRPLTRSCFPLLFLGRFVCLSSFFLKVYFSLWSWLFPLHSPVLTFLFHAKIRLFSRGLSPTSRFGDKDWWCCSFFFGKGGSGILAYYLHCGTEAIFSFSAGSICFSFSLKPALFCQLSAGLLRLNSIKRLNSND